MPVFLLLAAGGAVALLLAYGRSRAQVLEHRSYQWQTHEVPPGAKPGDKFEVAVFTREANNKSMPLVPVASAVVEYLHEVHPTNGDLPYGVGRVVSVGQSLDATGGYYYDTMRGGDRVVITR